MQTEETKQGGMAITIGGQDTAGGGQPEGPPQPPMGPMPPELAKLLFGAKRYARMMNRTLTPKQKMQQACAELNQKNEGVVGAISPQAQILKQKREEKKQRIAARKAARA